MTALVRVSDRYDGAGLYQVADYRHRPSEAPLPMEFTGPVPSRSPPTSMMAAPSLQQCPVRERRARRIKTLSAVGEAVGRHIEDAHTPCTRDRILPTAGRGADRNASCVLYPLREACAGPVILPRARTR